MDMEIQPAIAPLAEGELRLEPNDVARHMLESLALADGPFLFQTGEGVGEKTNNGILASQDGLALVVLETGAHEFRQNLGLGGWVAGTGRGVFEIHRGLEVT